MKRWVLFFLLCTGCGSSNPITPEPEPPTEITFEHVPVADMESYILQVNQKFVSINVLFTEYGGITATATNELAPLYWSRQYTLLMIARIHAIKASLHNMRPQNPYLRRLHINEFEAAFDDYLDGVTFFEQNLDFLSADVYNGLNQRMGAGNVHLIRLQIFLSALAGREVILGQPTRQALENNETDVGL